MATSESMSHRRTVVLILATLTAMACVLITVLAAPSLQDPFTITGELGTRLEVRSELIAALVVGVLLVAAGIGLAAGLVRTQLRRT